MGIGKQAKILSEKQMRTALAYVSEHHRYPLRDRVMLLLSFKAGLRAKEIALATWSMVLDSDGAVGDTLELRNVASKGKGGGRIVPGAGGVVDPSGWRRRRTRVPGRGRGTSRRQRRETFRFPARSG